MGVAKPERIMLGTRNINAPSNPCCWVTDSDEIISPTPMAESRNRIRPVYSAARLPSKGT